MDIKVISAEPVYPTKKRDAMNGGYFDVNVNGGRYRLTFSSVLGFILKNDEKLSDYVTKTFDVDNPESKATVSDVIRDLYELGIPMQDLVQQYINHVSDEILKDNAFLEILRRFFSFDDDDKMPF